jgi:hypothetical protein
MTHHNTRSKSKGAKPVTKKQKSTLSASAEDSLKKVQARTIQKVTPLIPKDLEITLDKQPSKVSTQQQQNDNMETDALPEVSLTSLEGNTASSSKNSQEPTAPQQNVIVPVTLQADTNNNEVTQEKNFEPNHLPVPPDQMYEKITRRTPYRAATLLDNVKGKNKSDKLKEVCHLFGQHNGYAGKTVQTIAKIPYMGIV